MILAWMRSGAARCVRDRLMAGGRWMTGVGVALACAGLAPGAQAEGCHGVSYGTLPVELIGGRATTMVKINGHDTRFILDTGAFYNIMPRAMATALGLPLQMTPPGFYVTGIGGSTDTWMTTVKSFGILGADLHNIDFIVGGSDAGTGLLGANLLDVADMDADLAEGKISLIKPTGCSKASMAYWAPDGNYNVASLLESRGPLDKGSHVTVMVNGKPVKAELDTGATTLITRRAALRVGIDLATATPGGTTGGIGAKHYESWIAKVAQYQVGTESIQNSRMQVIDGDIDTKDDPTEMLLGIDFFLSHHIFVANSQRKVYFTYNGGRVSVHDRLSQMSPASKPTTAARPEDEPQTPQAFGLRGQAHLSRGETAQGIADLDKAIAMAPDAPASAGFYFERAKARLRGAPLSEGEQAQSQADANRARLDAAMADLDASLRLAPDRPEVLLDRARLLLARRERARAQVDLAAAQRVVQPGSPQALLLARILTGLDRTGEALPLFDTWIKLHGEDGSLGAVLNERCWARGLANTALEGAVEDCRKAIKRDGEKLAYLDSAALIQLRLGHNSQALDLYAQVLAKEPRRGWAHYGHAVAALRLGQEAGKAELAAVKLSNPGVVAQALRVGVTPP